MDPSIQAFSSYRYLRWIYRK